MPAPADSRVVPPLLRCAAGSGWRPRTPLRPALFSLSRTVVGRLPHQRRWAQVHDVRFLATTQAPLRVLDKYRDKLDRKARAEGLSSIDELKKAYADRIAQQRKADAATVPGLDAILAADDATHTSTAAATTTGTTTPPSPVSQKTAPSAPTATAAAAASSSRSQVKPLSAILDLDKVRALPVPELTAIWRLRHASDPDSVCAVVPAATYAAMESLARLRPQFVLPVPHPGQGAEVHFLQWTFDAATATSTVLFTQLAEYKARGEFAQPHTTVTHHADLAADKGVVLMRGSVDGARGVKVADAQWLLMCLQRFYGGWDASTTPDERPDERAAERRKLLEWFGTGDQRFSIEMLLEETERLG